MIPDKQIPAFRLGGSMPLTAPVVSSGIASVARIESCQTTESEY